jgi:hypothetical protein
MYAFLGRFVEIVMRPDVFFERVREEKGWRKPLLHLIVLALWLSLGSVVVWHLDIPGDTPVNSSLGAQMDVYPYWRDTLLPQYGVWSYPLAMGFIVLEMLIITVIWTPIVFLAFRYLGGAKEPGGLLRAFQGFVYGLTPCAFGGFLPYLALFTGVYATLLQFGRGPAITLRNRTATPYLFTSLFLTLAIARYWSHGLL